MIMAVGLIDALVSYRTIEIRCVRCYCLGDDCMMLARTTMMIRLMIALLIMAMTFWC